jgi:hypothetical protein
MILKRPLKTSKLFCSMLTRIFLLFLLPLLITKVIELLLEFSSCLIAADVLSLCDVIYGKSFGV